MCPIFSKNIVNLKTNYFFTLKMSATYDNAVLTKHMYLNGGTMTSLNGSGIMGVNQFDNESFNVQNRVHVVNGGPLSVTYTNSRVDRVMAYDERTGAWLKQSSVKNFTKTPCCSSHCPICRYETNPRTWQSCTYHGNSEQCNECHVQHSNYIQYVNRPRSTAKRAPSPSAARHAHAPAPKSPRAPSPSFVRRAPRSPSPSYIRPTTGSSKVLDRFAELLNKH